MKIKIAHMTSVHSAFDVRIFHKECRTLVAAGYEVVLIGPGERDEVSEGVQIRAVPRTAGRLARMTRTVARVFWSAWRERAAIYHFHDPELIPAGIVLQFCGRNVIYDVHEDLPLQMSSKSWVPRWIRGFLSLCAAGIEALGARVFRGVVAATPTIAARFPARKTITVHNYPVASELGSSSADDQYSSRPPHAAYIGGIETIRGIREMIEAVAMIPESLDSRLVLAGRFHPPELLDSMKKIRGWGNVDYRGWQSRSEIAKLLANVRVGLVILHPMSNFLDSYPIKLFEYMAAGLPVIVSKFPLWQEIVEGTGCGFTVDPFDTAAIAKAIQWLLENADEAAKMGSLGRKAVDERFNWPTEARKLIEHYRVILGRKESL